MATRGQAEFNFIRQLIDEQEKLRKEQNRIAERERKKGSRSGLGSILGSIIAAIATGGSSLAVTGLATGLGSRVGSEVGERSVGGSSRINQGQFLFNQPDIRQRNFEQRQLDRDFNQGQLSDAIFKGVGGAALQGLSGGTGARFSQAGRTIGTGGGVGVTGNVLRAGSREALTKGLGRQVGRGVFGRGILGRTSPAFGTNKIDDLIKLILGL